MHIKPYSKGKLQQQDIDPWNDEEGLHFSTIEYPTFSQFQQIAQNTTPTNPQQEPRVNRDNKIKINIANRSFADNLRKYEKKKAEDLQNKKKKQVNFIQRNRKQSFCNADQRRESMLTHVFQHQRNKKQHSSFQAPVEPVNWSMIMYYENDKTKKKTMHRDLHSFLNYHSVKINRSRQHKTPQRSYIACQQSSKIQNDTYQKLLKLREGIRRRNLKSASASRKQHQNFNSIEHEDIRLSCAVRGESRPSPSKQIERRIISKTSASNRPKHSLECKVESLGLSKSIVAAKRDNRRDSRVIHSSQKNRAFSKMLNIEGSKMSAK